MKESLFGCLFVCYDEKKKEYKPPNHVETKAMDDALCGWLRSSGASSRSLMATRSTAKRTQRERKRKREHSCGQPFDSNVLRSTHILVDKERGTQQGEEELSDTKPATLV